MALGDVQRQQFVLQQFIQFVLHRYSWYLLLPCSLDAEGQ